MGWKLISLLSIFAAIPHMCLSSRMEAMLGHMLPLGSHREPEKVDERSDIPSSKEFFEKYVVPSKPVVFRGILKDCSMLYNWTDEYLLEKYPELELRLEAKTEKEGFVPIGNVGMGRDTLKNFIETYHQANKYVVSELPTPTWDEVLVPSFMTCGPFKKKFVEIDVWMSGGNTSSLLHKDAFNALNCLFNGTKEWKLFDYKYEKELYKASEPGNPFGGFSRINPEAVDLNKYPKVAKVPWSFTTVHKGDCLFLPKSMYHQVKSYGTMNTAVAMLLSRFDNINESRASFDDCPSEFLPLSKIDVDLQYPGKGNMFMGYSELDEVRKTLLDIQTDANEDIFQSILQAVDLKDHHPMSPKEKAEKLLKILQTGSAGKEITRETINKLPRSALREASYLVEPLLPSNTYEYEYFQISPREIATILERLVRKGDGIVKRKDFIKQYQEEVGGSEMFGNAFFDDLAGKGADKVQKDVLVETFVSAAKKYDRSENDQGDEGDENIEDDKNDAYIGKNADLGDEKDTDTHEDLGKQIAEGDFSDTGEGYEARGENEDGDPEADAPDDEDEDGDKEDEEEARQEEGEDDMKTKGRTEVPSNVFEKDEL